MAFRQALPDTAPSPGGWSCSLFPDGVEIEVRFKAVDAGLVLASNVNIIALNACWDNPFSQSFRNA